MYNKKQNKTKNIAKKQNYRITRCKLTNSPANRN